MMGRDGGGLPGGRDGGGSVHPFTPSVAGRQAPDATASWQPQHRGAAAGRETVLLIRFGR